MKNIIYTIILLVSSYISNGQTPQKQTKEYATIFMKVMYQGNTIFYDTKGLSRSPVMTAPDGRKVILYDVNKEASMLSDKKGKFIDQGQIINYMAKYGWVLKSNAILPYEGDGGNTDKSVIVNINKYIQLIIFERPFIVQINQRKQTK